MKMSFSNKFLRSFIYSFTYSFFKFTFELEENCFMILCNWFLSHNNAIYHSYTSMTPSWASLLPRPFHPSRSSQMPGWAPCVHTNFSSAIYLTRERVYVLLPLSPFILLSASSTVFTSLFSTSEPPFLPCK